MANFSVNQVRHFYAVEACKTSNAGVQSDFANVGDVQVKKTGENELFFLYKGVDGIVRSDLIPLSNITYAKAVDAAKMATPMRKISISLPSAINSGAPVSGQDYVLGINFKNFFAAGDDSQYYKDAAVHVTSAMDDAEKFFTAMKNALDLAFSREDNATATSNPYLSFTVSGSGSGAKLVIEEKEQPWTLGTIKGRRIMFDVFPSTIYTGGDDVIWAKQESNGNYYADETSTTSVGNGKKIADLEWFCMGERGDQYRMVGWPHVITTEYLVDPTKEYHTIELHYFFTDSGVNSYKTEKEITIAVPKGQSTANYTEVNKVIAAINYFAGTTLIATLSS